MKYVVFEAGSRAGFSAEMFFLDYINQGGNKDDVLYMVDDCQKVNEVVTPPNIARISFNDFLFLDKRDSMIFPADELTRQRDLYIDELARKNKFSFVENYYYSKKHINKYLEKATEGCRIKVPKTFDSSSICVRPNSQSAGSKGLQLLEDTCITEKLKIKEEYVVDVIRTQDSIKVYPRAVVLKNGYDRMIKPLKEDSEIGIAVKEFVKEADSTNDWLFSNVFHLQIALDVNGEYYYIESSKRISGTSIVNLFRGMNPFCFINGMECEEKVNPFQYDKWYRYEDFIRELKI